MSPVSLAAGRDQFARPDPPIDACSKTGPPPIDDYALIGDCRTAALVARDGSIDWLCLPNFSGPSVFGRILDPVRGGSFVLRPRGRFAVQRRYLDRTPVLETTFETERGRVRVIDFLTVLDGVRPMGPMRELARMIEGISGEVELEIAIDLRPDYARLRPRLECRGRMGWTWVWDNQIAVVRPDIAFARRGDTLEAEPFVREGERASISLSYTEGDPAVFPALGRDVQRRLEQTVEWWREWCDRCSYRGPHRDAVTQSAMVLRLLSHALSGAIVAAPTTSLPEAIGDRNWDYRYCWLRDAGLTAQALVGLGYRDEARAFLNWLLHATRLTWPELRVMYDIYGRTALKEQELAHLAGYRESRPVRIGNAAYGQRQLDVYGETVIAADAVASAGCRLDSVEARMLRGFGKTVCKQWREPDSGFWEIRGARRHYTLSKVMCWAALNRLLKMDERRVISIGSWARRFAQERDAMAEAIETRAFNRTLGSYVSELDGSEVDASLLLMACVGYKDAREARMRATYEKVSERLAKNGLLYRYSPGYDGAESREGTFGICSFWAVDNLAKRGEVGEAERQFEHVLGYASDLGLFSEEIDPGSGAALGNFPQAFTHVGLINAALAIEHARKGR